MKANTINSATSIRSQYETGFEIVLDATSCSHYRLAPLINQAAVFERDRDLLVLERLRVEVDDVHAIIFKRFADGRPVGNSQDRHLP